MDEATGWIAELLKTAGPLGGALIILVLTIYKTAAKLVDWLKPNAEKLVARHMLFVDATSSAIEKLVENDQKQVVNTQLLAETQEKIESLLESSVEVDKEKFAMLRSIQATQEDHGKKIDKHTETLVEHGRKIDGLAAAVERKT